ncbi:MAG: hypothetical protein HQ515_11510 [Phycisphaeraceae bacterium]|nr:hypothetical protein [Phycisphaeraceae bacterium]
MDVNQRRFLEPISKPVLKWVLIRASALMCLLCSTGLSWASSQTPLATSVVSAETPASRLTLVYEVGQTATYCLSSETTKSVRFEGIRPDDNVLAALDSAFTGRLTDVTWTQTVQAVDPNGQALVLIKIVGLNYQSYVKGDSVLDYDSTRAQNKATTLKDLIGLVYRIRVDVKGQVVQVLDADEALKKLTQGKAHFNSAADLVSEKVIRARHTVKPLNGAPDQAMKHDTWTSAESFLFGSLGGKGFKKTYVCQGAGKDSSLVEISMTGSESVDKSVSSVSTPRLPLTSENQFTGTLTLDTRTGQIKMYRESLEVTWSLVYPASVAEAQPHKSHMTARQAFLLERKESVQ